MNQWMFAVAAMAMASCTSSNSPFLPEDAGAGIDASIADVQGDHGAATMDAEASTSDGALVQDGVSNDGLGSIDAAAADSGDPTAGSCSTDVPVSSGDASVGTCPTGMVFIAGTSFLMGDSDGLLFDSPAHRVTLSSYCIDRTEVTVSAYRACTDSGCTTPELGFECALYGNWTRTDHENHPINCVYWTQARAYCRSGGGDLPTEAQWEYAARGNDGRRYPWGSAVPSNEGCWGHSPGDGELTCPVGSFPAGASPFGLLDMAGNVSEWTADWYWPYSAGPTCNPTIPEPGWGMGRFVMHRGGGYNVFAAPSRGESRLRTVSRDWLGDGVPESDVGFRCVHPPL